MSMQCAHITNGMIVANFKAAPDLKNAIKAILFNFDSSWTVILRIMILSYIVVCFNKSPLFV